MDEIAKLQETVKKKEKYDGCWIIRLIVINMMTNSIVIFKLKFKLSDTSEGENKFNKRKEKKINTGH